MELNVDKIEVFGTEAYGSRSHNSEIMVSINDASMAEPVDIFMDNGEAMDLAIAIHSAVERNIKAAGDEVDDDATDDGEIPADATIAVVYDDLTLIGFPESYSDFVGEEDQRLYVGIPDYQALLQLRTLINGLVNNESIRNRSHCTADRCEC